MPVESVSAQGGLLCALSLHQAGQSHEAGEPRIAIALKGNDFSRAAFRSVFTPALADEGELIAS